MDKSKYFTEILAGERVDTDFLQTMSMRYSWFDLVHLTLAHALKSENKNQEWKRVRSSHSLLFTVSDYPKIGRNINQIIEKRKSLTMEVIDRFLSQKLKRITLKESAPKGNLASNAKSEIITEKYAQILVSQELFESAIDIYDKLCLKYPEKITYFALCKEKIKEKMDEIESQTLEFSSFPARKKKNNK